MFHGSRVMMIQTSAVALFMVSFNYYLILFI